MVIYGYPKDFFVRYLFSFKQKLFINYGLLEGARIASVVNEREI